MSKSYLSRLIEARGSTQSEVARRLGVSRQSVYAWCNGALPRSPQLISRLADYLGVTSEDLIDSGPETETPAGVFIPLPYLTGVHASCGGGDFPVSCPDISRLRVSRAWLRARAPSASANSVQIITADGDSMSPTIEDGDLILIDVSRTEATDAIFALVINSRLFIKRIQRTPRGLKILSDNPAYQPFDVDESDTVQIIGRVCCRASFKNL